MNNHIIIYSHGFGVKKDSRGMFTDIAANFPEAEHIMFNYDEIDETNNTATVPSLHKQAEMLLEIFQEIKKNHPTTPIDVIGHSQGCIVAGLAKLNARKTILLAPPMRTVDPKEKWRKYIQRHPGVTIEDDMTIVPRRDGSITIVSEEYWQSCRNLPDSAALYNGLSEMTDLTIISAKKDKTVGRVNYSILDDPIKIIKLKADHNFKNKSRGKMIDVIKEVIE